MTNFVGKLHWNDNYAYSNARYHIKYIKVKLTLLSGIKCTAKIYHTVGTVPKSNRKIVEKATSIPITHIYMTAH
jgi:hypothetical protein